MIFEDKWGNLWTKREVSKLSQIQISSKEIRPLIDIEAYIQREAR
jgi:hypothetical protein